MTKFRKNSGLLIIHGGHTDTKPSVNVNKGIEPLYPAGIDMDEPTKGTETKPAVNKGQNIVEPLYPAGIQPNEGKEDNSNLLLPTFFSEK